MPFVKLAEIKGVAIGCLDIHMLCKQIPHGILLLAQAAERGWFRRHEDHHAAELLSPPLAIAASGRLGDGCKAGEGAVDHGEINIDAGFHQLGADHSHGCTG